MPSEQNLQQTFKQKNDFLKKYKTTLVLFLVALAPLFTYFALNIYYKSQSGYLLYTHQKQQEEAIKKQREEYQKLIETQSKQQKNSKNDDGDIQKRKAIGNYTLNVILVNPPTLQTSNILPLIEKLEENDKKTITSLYYLNTFYQKWAKHYGIDDFNIELKFHGPYNLDVLEQVGDIALYWGKDPFATTRLQDSFNNLLTNNNIKFTDKDLAIFLYFDDSFTQPDSDDDQDRFYEHKKFRSFADQHTAKTYINVYRFDPAFAKTVVEITGHEVLHLYGANDKYEESKSVTRICSEKGRGDLDLKPVLPQKTADIMCMYIEKENDEFVRGSFSAKTLTINQLTAKEIGWKD